MSGTIEGKCYGTEGEFLRKEDFYCGAVSFKRDYQYRGPCR